ncbi:MAG: YetF domain-containing protein [Caldilinea sp.]|uniref:DUF421 domain-containing protein n=1 Tax=Caldilinea sp. TaxID=2293560 RepID=UPI002CA3A28C|nr:DUF421 domain-containing protein [Caldilinea sp.]
MFSNEWTSIFFNSWGGLLRIAVVGVCAYIALLVLLRISGKRTLSKMNAFDFVVTVALGSTLATILLSKDTALADGLLALALLITFQFIITWLSVRFKSISKLVKAEPRLLYYRGDFLWEAMKAERVTQDAVLQAMRKQGVGRPEQVEAVILETDGGFSVVRSTGDHQAAALKGVAGVSMPGAFCT